MFDNKILIVDDSKMNHEILKDIIKDKYEIISAFDGTEAMNIIDKSKDDISLVLLDLVMPNVNGFEVLNYMYRNSITDDLPVIVISSETDPGQIEEAYDKGVIDFIQRPFDEKIVLRRIKNTIALYGKKRNLEQLVVKQFFEKEKNNQTMIEVLSNIVEFRNGESGQHVLHIRAFTSILLHTLKNLVPQYNLTSEKITCIANASALHDIGKISIPSEILNKPGKLEEEEFEIMKNHSAYGANILLQSECYKESKFIQIAHDICRWHHERWNGKGYPDGLCGEEIPISAQVVALADVYDALISERCYKAAYSHEKAINMILAGECGQFNPLLMECLKILAPKLKNGFNKEYLSQIESNEISSMAGELMTSINQVTSILNMD